ncbi:MAG: NAD(P)-dependent oxidoreductase, partial [Gemmatimonadales bacterium]|nr:NAD(P)-dependent oxidoreductase [Gemmatimonadales bacterium]
MSSIAFLGTGLLGSAFVEAALGRGDTVTVWNRTRSKAAALVPFGAIVADTPADAVRGAKRIHLVLSDDAVVDAVIKDITPALGADAIIIDHTTTQPALTAERASRLAAAGIRYLHCPVFIGPAAARQALGTILVAGPRSLYESVQPALAAQAAKVEYVGERADLAAVYKLAGNAFIIGIVGLVADTLTMAKAVDVEPKAILEVLRMFNPAAIITGRGKAIAERNYAPSFELVMARKDVRLMLETAGEETLCMLPGLAERIDALLAEGHAADDLAVLGRDAVKGERGAASPRWVNGERG